MRNRGELPYGWILILVGAILLVIASPSFFIPVGYSESSYHATIDTEPRDPKNISSLPAECQQLAHHLADGQNVSEEVYEIQIGGTTHTVKRTNISRQAVEGGDTLSGDLSAWHLGGTFCGDHIDLGSTYYVDGENYRFLEGKVTGRTSGSKSKAMSSFFS